MEICKERFTIIIILKYPCVCFCSAVITNVYVAFLYSDGTTTCSTGVLAYSIGTYCNAVASGTTGQVAPAKATAVYG